MSDTKIFTSRSPSWKSRSGSSLRRTYSNGLDPWSTQTSVNRAIWTLIGINAAVFATWQYAVGTGNKKLKQQLSDHATLSKYNMQAGRYWTLVTSAFSHMDLGHFVFNMFALNAFGGVLSFVPGVGAVHVVSLTLGSAVAGSLGWLYHREKIDQSSEDRGLGPNAQHGVKSLYQGLGASGMVMGTGAAAACLMPFAPMNLMFIPIPLPLWAITCAYFAVDAYYLDSGSKVGHAAHLCGSIYGVLYYFANLGKFGGVRQFVRRGIFKR